MDLKQEYDLGQAMLIHRKEVTRGYWKMFEYMTFQH